MSALISLFDTVRYNSDYCRSSGGNGGIPYAIFFFHFRLTAVDVARKCRVWRLQIAESMCKAPPHAENLLNEERSNETRGVVGTTSVVLYRGYSVLVPNKRSHLQQDRKETEAMYQVPGNVGSTKL